MTNPRDASRPMKILHRIFSIALAAALAGCETTTEPSSTEPGMKENEINGGWYGWIGNHTFTGAYAPEMNAAFLRRHHINWYWLGHQWVVPFLVADMADVRQTMIEESKRARIWVELYWWGDHSTWEGFTGKSYPGLYERLKASGIPAGGDDLRGKDWFAIADDPAVMRSVKKTIRWQLDTIARYVGSNTVYGVLLSEEEPEHGIDVTVGQAGAAKYQRDRDLAREKITRVHNELYDFVKSLYPRMNVSPGFYPAWVKPGTLKYDAVVMDNYPYPGLEEKKFREWLAAYGDAPEQYVLLWGYGNLDSQIELRRFEKITKLYLDHGIRNLGFFRPEMALRDPIFRLFDTRGVGSYAPYDLEEHRQSVIALADETKQVAAALAPSAEPFCPPPIDRARSRAVLCQLADQIYAYRKQQLDAAYRNVVQTRQWLDLARLIALADAEGWIREKMPAIKIPDARQLARWEKLSKEFRALPQYYAAVAPREREIRALADQLVSAITLPEVADGLRSGDYTAAYRSAAAERQRLVRACAERSWEIALQLGNSYGYPLTVEATLTATFADGVTQEIYRGVPFEASKEPSLAFAFYLSRPPVALTLATGSWSGDLSVKSLRVFNSRQAATPTSFTADHAKGVEQFLANPSLGFVLSPWGSISQVTLRFSWP